MRPGVLRGRRFGGRAAPPKGGLMSAAPPARPDSAHDILRPGRRPLDAFFAPSSVAVIGATETPHSVGCTLLSNLIHGGFRGDLFPVNPKRPQVLGLPAFPSIKAVSRRVDLAVIVTPAPSVPGI